jgi:hypothetical protein
MDAATSTDWHYATCPLDTDPWRLGPFEDLVRVWQDRRRGRLLPSRHDFDIGDFAPWLGRVFIARVERDPFDLRFTLWGTQLREWWRVDYTGRTIGELSADPVSWQIERRYFQAMDLDPFLGIASGYLSQHGRDHIKVVGLDLPMSEGHGLSQVISAHMQIDVERRLSEMLPEAPLTAFAGSEA